MDRRAFLGALSVLVAVRTAEAQQSGRVYRIGWLAPSANNDNLDAFRSGLRTLGYVEGTSVVIEPQYAEGGGEQQLVGAAAQLGRRRLDVIVTDGSAATAALKRQAISTPVVFVSGDPIALGLVTNLSRPGGTMTGFAIIATELNVKRLELLSGMFPRNSRLGLLHEPRHRHSMIAPIEAAARSLGFPLIRLEVRAAAEIERVFATAVREHVTVVMPMASALFHAEKQHLVSLAAKYRLPAMYESRAFAEAGGLMSYGADVAAIFRRAATYVDRILRGEAKPADLPVEQPTKFDLVINVKTAKALGLSIPPSLLQRADHVIE